MIQERIEVVPDLLCWARTTAGYDTAGAAKRLGVSVATLNKWEDGQLNPTIKQLRKIAKTYKRPLAVLLLPTPPQDFSPIKDFRKVVDSEAAPWSPSLHSEFKRAMSQREILLELADLSPESVSNEEELPKIAELNPDDAGAVLRRHLRLDDIPAGIWTKQNEILNSCIERLEFIGILVIQTKGVKRSEMRAFSVSERPFPVVALNGSDSPRARLFSLFHELCHIALNLGGLCDLHEVRGQRVGEPDLLEHLCNQVAAAVLMPRSSLLDDPRIEPRSVTYGWSLDELRDLGRTYGASSESTLLRLISLEKATWDLYWERKPELDQLYEQARADAKAKQQAAAGFPSYYTIKARDLGRGFVSSVLDAYQGKAISSLDVADYLDVRYDQLPKLQKVVRR